MRSAQDSLGTALVAVATLLTVMVFAYLVFDAATTKIPSAKQSSVSRTRG